MTKRMLIDASHAEETRVVVLDGNRLEDFDSETAARRQLKGNIYLAKVVRVEPSLQAAFVEYGGNRHGFLAFSEIHPDYYQIPIADRQRLLEMQAEEARRELEEEDREVEAEASGEPAEALALETRVAPEGQADGSESFAEAAEPSVAEYPTESDRPQAQPLEIRSEAVSGPVPSEPATASNSRRIGPRSVRLRASRTCGSTICVTATPARSPCAACPWASLRRNSAIATRA